MFKQLASTFIGIGIFIAAITFFSAVYIVDETKQVFVTQFGDIISGPHNGPGKDEAGLYFRIPFITKVHEFEKRYLEWDGDPNEVTTKDKLFVFIDTYARWRIVDAKLFFEKVRNESGAQSRLDDILDGEARIVVAANDLVEVIRSRQREAVIPEANVLDDESQLKPFNQGRSALAQQVLDNAGPNLKEEFGIELMLFGKIIPAFVLSHISGMLGEIEAALLGEGESLLAGLLGQPSPDLVRFHHDRQFRIVAALLTNPTPIA